MNNLTQIEKIDLQEKLAFTFMAEHLKLDIQEFRSKWLNDAFTVYEVATLRSLI